MPSAFTPVRRQFISSCHRARYGVLLVALVLAQRLPSTPAAPGPLADAVAVWHMADEHDSAGADSRLVVHGDVRLGVPLESPERAESVRRGGDGKIAVFRGGWLSADQGAGGELNPAGTDLSLCARLRDPTGKWDGPLFSKHGGHARLSYNLFATTLHGRMAIGFELGTDFKSQPLQLSFPTARLGATSWHDVIVRYSGHRLELFIDGVLADEEWPAGQLRLAGAIPCLLGAEVGSDGQAHGRGELLLDHAALWRRALTDEEIVGLSGGAEAVARADRDLLGPENAKVQHFWKPRGDAAVGDCMPFYDGQRWHLYYLQDRHGHRSKWGLGAHQWAHASSADLTRWQHHPMAVPITDPHEGSICTGSVFLQSGEYRAYYAVRTIDGSPAPLSLAVSRDGIHFEKTRWTQTLTAPYAGGPARDPHVFQDPRTGIFHMLVTTSLAAESGAGRGCLAHLVSADLRAWTQEAPFLVPGLPGEPECAEWFEWHGWYYLVFSNGAVARYRMARDPLGPWITPPVAALDGAQCAVMKSAPYRGDRRIGAAFLPRAGGGYAGQVLFRELVQQADGTLSTRFVAELMPETGAPVKLQPAAPGSADASERVVLRSDGRRRSAIFTGLPPHAQGLLRLRAAAGTKLFGIALGAGEANPGTELRFLPGSKRIEVVGGAALDAVDGLEQELALEWIVQDDMFDLCLNGRRTLASRIAPGPRDRLVLFCEGGELEAAALQVRPLSAK